MEFFGTPHPRIYILNEIISKNFIAHFNEKRNGMQHPPIVHFNEKRNGMQHPPIVHFNEKRNGMQHPPIVQ